MLTAAPAPGVAFEFADSPRTRAEIRTDFAGFVGFAERGPFHRPVRVHSWRQYRTVFGGTRVPGFLPHAVRAFFENGGVTCHVVRALVPPADESRHWSDRARHAYADLPIWRKRGAAPIWGLQVVADSPGRWGNGVTIEVVPQGSREPRFTMLVRDRSGETWRLPDCSLDPGGDRFLDDVMARTSGLPVRVSTIHTGIPNGEYALRSPPPIERATVRREPERPPEPCLGLEPTRVTLRGGRDGLAAVELHHLTGCPDAPDERSRWGLMALFTVDDVSMVALPDAVAFPRVETQRSEPPSPSCEILEVDTWPTGGGWREVRDETVRVRPGWTFRDGPSVVRPRLCALAGGHGLTLEELLDANPAYRGVDTSEWPGSEALVTIPEPPVEHPPFWTSEDTRAVAREAIRFCEIRGDCVALLDPPPALETPEEVAVYRNDLDTSWAGLYWPWLLVQPEAEGPGAGDPRAILAVPPSGAVAGLTAAADLAVGPHRTPAGQTVRGAIATAAIVEDDAHGALNARGIDVFRERSGRGVVLAGARSMAREQGARAPWRHLNVRRVMLAIREAIEERTQWTVFESNDRALRDDLRDQIRAFLTSRWRRGWLVGDRPEEAFYVRCDDSTNPPESVEAGCVVAVIGLRFPPPIEWIEARIGRTAAGIELLDVERA